METVICISKSKLLFPFHHISRNKREGPWGLNRSNLCTISIRKKETVVFFCNFFKNMIGRDGILLCKWNVTYFYLSQPWNCGNKACPFSMSIHLSHSCKITHIQMSLLHSFYLCFTGHCYHVPKTPIPLSLSNFSVTTKWHSSDRLSHCDMSYLSFWLIKLRMHHNHSIW